MLGASQIPVEEIAIAFVANKADRTLTGPALRPHFVLVI
jgi:hypothetical protein